MGKLNKSKGQMYNWVTHQWSPGRGCSHDCSYCYMKSMRFGPDPGKVFTPDMNFPVLGKERVIFVGHTCDMWAQDIPDSFIEKVLIHCFKFRDNKYIFQSKNPLRFTKWKMEIVNSFPVSNLLFGTTIETNRDDLIKKYSSAPSVDERFLGLRIMKDKGFHTFVTIEPIMDFDLTELSAIVRLLKPDFINIGADSKKNDLPEPSWNKVREFIYNVQVAGIEIRNKENLQRLGK